MSRYLAKRPAVARTGHPSMVVGVMGLSASWKAGNKALQIQCLTYLALIRTYQGSLGHYKAYSYARFCVLAALSEDWHDAYAHARRAHEVGMFFHPMFSIHLHRGVEALLQGGDERLARGEARRFAERARTNKRDRMSHLRSLAVLSDWEGDTERTIGRCAKPKR